MVVQRCEFQSRRQVPRDRKCECDSLGGGDRQTDRPSMDHESQVNAVTFSPDGKTIATASDDKTARLWDASTGKPIGVPMKHEKWVAATFNPDGKSVATASEGHQRLWDARSGKPIGEPLKHKRGVNAATFSPDGKTVATASATARRGCGTR